MWQLLKPSDIARAMEDLRSRRVALVKRQQEELDRLAASRAEVENLDKLADAFCRRFRKTTSVPAIAVAPASPVAARVPIAAAATRAEPAPPAKRPDPLPLAKRPEPLPIVHARERPQRPLAAASRERDRSHSTNFDIFSRAISKSTY